MGGCVAGLPAIRYSLAAVQRKRNHSLRPLVSPVQAQLPRHGGESTAPTSNVLPPEGTAAAVAGNILVAMSRESQLRKLMAIGEQALREAPADMVERYREKYRPLRRPDPDPLEIERMVGEGCPQ